MWCKDLLKCFAYVCWYELRCSVGQSLFTLTLLPDLRIVLNAAIRLAGFIRIDYTHALSRMVKEKELLDFELVNLINEKLRSEERLLAVSIPEAIHLYILVDLYAKSFLADVSTHIKKNFFHKTLSEAEFLDLRSQHLGIAEKLLELMQKRLTLNSEFSSVKEKLDKISHEIF